MRDKPEDFIVPTQLRSKQLSPLEFDLCRPIFHFQARENSQ